MSTRTTRTLPRARMLRRAYWQSLSSLLEPSSPPALLTAKPDSAMPSANQIFYVEFQASDLEQTKRFFADVFGWKFTDYGPDYTAFGEPDLGGGFARGDKRNRFSEGGVAVVLYTRELERVRDAVRNRGGTITRDIFSFPGGRRFHFTEPSGNELAVASIDES